jgi:protein-S-isoprenylcysteine O-methyltransferase Ste14
MTTRPTRAFLYVRGTGALILPITVDVVVPVALLRTPGGRVDVGAARFVGIPLMALGCWVLLDSVFMRFAHEGRGTLAPVDPPRFVVRGGAYRLVRNPMYLANLAAIVGSGLFFQSWRLLVWAGALFAAFHLFVVVYEEPTLRRRFGEVYESYQRDVGRWVP